MPYPNEHACRLEDPGKYDRVRRQNCAQKHDGKCIDVIYGVKAGKSEIQALRYDKKVWTAGAAKSHCKSRDGTFEAAAKEKKSHEPDHWTVRMEEFRVIREENEAPRLEGYAAKFNSLSRDLGGFKEKIAPGAFGAHLKRADVRFLFNHDRNFVLGRTKAKTLTLEEDDQGLRIENIPPDTTWAKDLLMSVERGDINEMSFGFKTLRDSWNDKGKMPIRTLEEVELMDVAIATFAAYKETNVQVRQREILQDEGIDVDGISRVLVKREHGLDMTEDDWIEIDSIIKVLEKLRETLPQGVETDADEETETEQTHRKEELERDRKLRLRRSQIWLS